MPPQDLNEDVMAYIGYERFPMVFHKTKKDKAALFAMVPEYSGSTTYHFELDEQKTVDVFLMFLQNFCDFTVTKEVKDNKLVVTIQEYSNPNSYIQ
jgi:hypothetical protein